MGDLFGGGSETSTVKTVPWTNGDRLRRLSGKAERQFENGVFQPGVYQGDWVAPMSDYTRQAMGMMTNVYSPQAIKNLYQQQAANTRGFGDAVSGLAATGGGMSGAADMYGRMMDQNQQYRDFDQIRDSVTDRAKAELGSTFGGGLMNGGLIAQEYGKGITDALAGVEYDAYNQAQNRALQAGGQLDSAYNNMMGRQITGMGMMPQVNEMMQGAYDWKTGNMDARANNFLRAGAIGDQYNQRLADADRMKFGETDAQQRNNLQNYANFLMGISGLGSSQASTAPGTSPIANVAGGAATGLGTYGTLAGMGLGGPLGIAGGVLAGLGSIF